MNKRLKRRIVIVIAMLLIFGAGYYFISPSITLVNHAGVTVESAIVTLPDSRLDFGSLKDQQENRIYYQLGPKTGSYRYHIKLENGGELLGHCLALDRYDLHKRVVITILSANQVSCQE